MTSARDQYGTPRLDRWAGRFEMAIIATEAMLAFWLVAGLWPEGAWHVAVCVFTALACVSLYHAGEGKLNCGCFGPVPVSPWQAVGIDSVAVASLLLWIPMSGTVQRRVPMSVLTGVALFSMVVLADTTLNLGLLES